MQDYDVVTSDDHKVGHVVGTEGEYVIVEHGMLRKSKHAVPRDLASVDDDEQVVRLTVSRDVFERGPATKNGDEIDRIAVAQYYGLAEGYEAPDTQGFGDVTATDPARTAEQDARRFGQESPDEQRVRTRHEAGTDPAIPGPPPKGAVGIHQDRRQVKE